jgi:methanogenic corrinoid protein MtbC1
MYTHMNEKSAATVENALLRMDRLGVIRLVEGIVAEESSLSLFDDYLTPAMENIGKRWENGEASLAQVYMAGRICEQITLSYADGESHPVNSARSIAITVLDDYHVLGKRVIAAFLRGAGYGVDDYGRTSPEELVHKVIEHTPDILMISVLMLPSALRVKTVTEEIRKALSDPPRIVVGGAPFRIDPGLGKEIGADVVGMNAGDAVRTARAYYSGAPA